MRPKQPALPWPKPRCANEPWPKQPRGASKCGHPACKNLFVKIVHNFTVIAILQIVCTHGPCQNPMVIKARVALNQAMCMDFLWKRPSLNLASSQHKNVSAFKRAKTVRASANGHRDFWWLHVSTFDQGNHCGFCQVRATRSMSCICHGINRQKLTGQRCD